MTRSRWPFLSWTIALLLTSVSAFATTLQSGMGSFDRLTRFVEVRGCRVAFTECNSPLSSRERRELDELLSELTDWYEETLPRLQAQDWSQGLAVEIHRAHAFSLTQASRMRGLRLERVWRLAFHPEDERARSHVQTLRESAAFDVLIFDSLLRLTRALQDTPRLRRVIEHDSSVQAPLKKLLGHLNNSRRWPWLHEFLVAEQSLTLERGGLSEAEVLHIDFLRGSYAAERLKSRDYQSFAREGQRLSAQLAQSGLGHSWERFLGRLSQIFGNAVGKIQWRTGKLLPLARDARQLQTLEGKLKTFDLLLEKTPFRLTDYFIPGHFGHVAMWIGDEKDWGHWPVLHQGRLLELRHHPLVLALRDKIKNGRLVLESLRLPGVTLNPLASFMDVDDLVALRPAFPSDPGATLLRALELYGRPYDFNFDVDTRKAIVCSELAYAVFEDIHWPYEQSFGRYTISPDHVAFKGLEEFAVVLMYLDGKEIREGQREGLARVLRASPLAGSYGL